jgi:glycerophosphoryl diester phosphodiesterase
MAGTEHPLIVGHRGASHDAPENTLAAFRLAWEQGADAVEGDFQLTRDRKIVCIHDRTARRTAGIRRIVCRNTLRTLRELDVGRWKGRRWAGEPIPTLREVLETVPGRKKILVEIKSGPRLLPVLRRNIRATGVRPDHVILMSFRRDVVSRAKRTCPGHKVFWLVEFKRGRRNGPWRPSAERMLASAKRLKADGVGLSASPCVDDAMAAAVRKAGLMLNVWTVDDLRLARRFVDLGVGFLTTNRPGWLKRKLHGNGS